LGLVIYRKGPFPGSGNDRSAFNTTPFVEEACNLLSEGELILTDGGFRGPGHIIHQFVEQELNQASSVEAGVNMHDFNEEFIFNRTLVEHCIHRLKSRVKMLQKRYPMKRESQPILFDAACCIYNRIRRIRLKHSIDLYTEARSNNNNTR